MEALSAEPWLNSARRSQTLKDRYRLWAKKSKTVDVTKWKWLDPGFADIFMQPASSIQGELGGLMSPWGSFDAIFTMWSHCCPVCKGWVVSGRTLHDIDGTCKTSLRLWSKLFPDFKTQQSMSSGTYYRFVVHMLAQAGLEASAEIYLKVLAQVKSGSDIPIDLT
jgi:hypothetical protein